MGAGVSSFIRVLVSEEVKRRVAEAAKDGQSINLKAHAVEIERAYPGSYLSDLEIAAALLDEASRVGVPTEALPSLTKAA